MSGMISLCGNTALLKWPSCFPRAQVAESASVVVDVTTAVLSYDLVTAFIIAPNASVKISNHTQHIMCMMVPLE